MLLDDGESASARDPGRRPGQPLVQLGQDTVRDVQEQPARPPLRGAVAGTSAPRPQGERIGEHRALGGDFAPV
ncbi:hypothetical protein HNQ79_001107 [Streptomyces candidus]|uniref:Uncharacterized protein n=1 Tax=Streptomyces candidus TaxID=67283 RepID=A0A7X0HDS1_9ACTN|nr:hypothetical protein [Streptomyces candidus]GHH35876.1 hypothetical protein GCM10018773_09950 [Streptomyces candidus]